MFKLRSGLAYVVFWHELSTEHNEPVRYGNLDTLLQQGTQVSLLRREMNHKWWKCIEVKQYAAEREYKLILRKLRYCRYNYTNTLYN